MASRRKAPFRWLAAPLLLSLGLFMFAAGFACPVFFGHQALESLPSDADGRKSQVAALVGSGETALARAIALTAEDTAERRHLRDLIALGWERHTQATSLVGGRAPFLEVFLDSHSWDHDSSNDAAFWENGGPPFARWAAQQPFRSDVVSFLRKSRLSLVNEILDSRRVQGFIRFASGETAAAAPLDVATSLLALLVQENALQPGVSLELHRLIVGALSGNDFETARLEAVYLAALAVARQYSFAEAAIIGQRTESWEAFARLGPLLRELRSDDGPDGTFSNLIAAIHAVDDLALLINAAQELPDFSQTLQQVTARGPAAARTFLEDGRPIHTPPGWMRVAMSHVPAETIAALGQLPEAVRWFFKIIGLAGGAFLSASALAVMLSFGRTPFREAACHAATGAIAMLSTLVALLAIEPGLISGSASRATPLRLAFELDPDSLTLSSMNPDEAASQLDQTTLYVLLAFFGVQVVLYMICLTRIRSISRSPFPASVRRQLLDNEDVLFDGGLYIGLAGTVVSLLMLALGIVQASLVAAYASTLFGILFVAALKVFNVRPLRRQLLLEERSRVKRANERWNNDFDELEPDEDGPVPF